MTDHATGTPSLILDGCTVEELEAGHQAALIELAAASHGLRRHVLGAASADPEDNTYFAHLREIVKELARRDRAQLAVYAWADRLARSRRMHEANTRCDSRQEGASS